MCRHCTASSPLLWAYKQTGGTKILDGARRHLDASLDVFVNEDDSTIEFGDFDVEMGKMVRQSTILGAHGDSGWSWGQA
jgi:hypothetical protein